MYNLDRIISYIVGEKMNNKGFAISSILYMLILITGLLFVSTLSLLTYRKNVIVSKMNNISGQLGGNLTSQYRYMTANGEWSNWLNYENKNDIDYSFTVSRILNSGTAGERYDLIPTDVILDIVNGDAYLRFNGTTSRAINTSGQTVVANTILLEVRKDNNGAIVSYGTSQQGIFYDASNRINMRDISGNTQISTPTYANGNIFRYIFILDRVNGNYKVYQNGILVGTTGTTNISRFDLIGLGHFRHNNTSFFAGNIYKAIFSSLLITDSEAIEISRLNNASKYEEILHRGNASVKYGPFIEYRQVAVKNEVKSDDVFKTRYIRDFMAGTLSGTSNQILDINVFAKFDRATKFYNVMVGGTFSGTYVKDRNHANQVSLGRIRVTNGSFTHVNTRPYNITTVMEVLTPYTTINSFGSGLLLFIGSDITRFPVSAVNSFNGFVFGNYGDMNSDGNFGWYYFNGASWVRFIPNENDAIVGYVTKNAGDSILTLVDMFSPTFTFNVALGKRVTSDFGTTDINGRNISIVVDGNVQVANFFTNGTGARHVEIDLGAEYNVTRVRLFHQYITAPVVTLGTRTILYNDSKMDTYMLWDHATKGLYVEDSLGNGTTLYVDPNMMPNTHRTRFIRSNVNGRHDLATNIYNSSSTWIEIEAYDLSGHNIARNRTATTTGPVTNLVFLTDGNTTNVYTAGNGHQVVTIDLGHEYAIQEVNVIHNIGNLAFQGTITTLLSANSLNNNIIYDNRVEGIYREITNGIRIRRRIPVSGEETIVPPMP